jgi:regulator of cell morphogenesis and NO signaling
MKMSKVEKQFVPDVHPMDRLNEAIERLQEEHVVLEAGLLELYGMARSIDFKEDSTNWQEAIYELRNKVAAYKKELIIHSSWEDFELFPLIVTYFNEIPGSIALIEQEHELALQFIDAFITAVDKLIGPVNRNEAMDMAAYLHLAYGILAGHFKKEEDTIESLADDISLYGY